MPSSLVDMLKCRTVTADGQPVLHPLDPWDRARLEYERDEYFARWEKLRREMQDD